MIAGVDLSTKQIDLVRRPPGNPAAADGVVWRRLALTPAMQFAEKDALIAREAGMLLLDDPFWWEDVWLAGVEYPYTDAKLMGSVVLKTILGAVVASIPKHVHVIPLPARYWTPYFLRTNRADPLPKIPRKKDDRKPLIKARALELLDADDVWPQDAYDAFGIAVAVEEINEPALA